MGTAKDETSHLSPLKRAYLALERAQARIDELERARTEPIAVVGMGCRLPGGIDGPDAYWDLLRDGVDAICETPADRWDVDSFYSPDPGAPGKMNTRNGGFLRGRIDEFDPQFFGISPREAESMDPQQRLLLEVAWEALEHAAQAQERLPASPTGVFIGITSHDYADVQRGPSSLLQLGMHNITGCAHNAAAGRLSYCMGFNGPCLALDTACSSSLVAVHLACRSLLDGECRRALAGGVNLILSPVATIALSKANVLAPDGRCRAFDKDASGMVRGEGCSVVVLKRLSHAQEDGDNILALIRGTAVNQDGPSSGLTVPNGPAQEALVRRALAVANLDPSDIDYIEAHGTGTPLGDPIELRALGNVFCGRRGRPLVVGSVKTNIGHTEACAGIAGLIKVVLSLRHQAIPPNLNFREPTPHIPWDGLPLLVPERLMPWPSHGRPRRAGVSSFGFSGVNAHVVLEDAPPAPARREEGQGGEVRHHRPLHLLALSGRTEAALRQLAERFATYLGDHQELAPGDVCHSANAGRVHLNHRVALVAGSTPEVHGLLSAFLDGRSGEGLAHREVSGQPKVVFLFPGQGLRCAGRGRELYETQPDFRRVLDQCDGILGSRRDRPLLDELFPDSRSEPPLAGEEYSSAALFALEYGLAKLWISWGVQPAVVMGHGVGEFVAAAVAGVFGLEDGLGLLAEWDRLLDTLPRDGAMFAVAAGSGTVEAAVEPLAREVSIAAMNSPQSTVISGRSRAVGSVVANLRAAGIESRRMAVNLAHHSPLVDPILSDFERRAREFAYGTPRISLVSSLDGRIAAASVASSTHWRRLVREPICHESAVRTLRENGANVFVEVGPDATLVDPERPSSQGSGPGWLSSLREGRSDWRQMLETMALLYVTGVRVDWLGFDRPYRHHRVALPTYPFQCQRYWLETAGTLIAPMQTRGSWNRRGHPLLGDRLDLAGSDEIQFESEISRETPSYLGDHRVFEEVVLPAAAFLELSVAAGAASLGSAELIVEDVVLQQALVLTEQSAKAVQTRLTPDGAGGLGFEIFSRAAGETSRTWTRHAVGNIVGPLVFARDPSTDLAALRASAGEEIDVQQVYRQCHARGVGLGPRFQAIRRLWVSGESALGEISLPDMVAKDTDEYYLHPVLLDAALQVMCAVFREVDDRDVYLPVAIDRVRVHQRAGTAGWSHVKVHPIVGTHQMSLRVDLLWFSAEGKPVASIEGLHLKQASRGAVSRAAGPAFQDWLYEVRWRPQIPSTARRAPESLRGGDEVRGLMVRLAESLRGQPGRKAFDGFMSLLDDVSLGYVFQALQEMGCEFRPGRRETTRSLAGRLGVVDRHFRMFERLLEILAEAGILARQDAHWTVSHEPGVYEPDSAVDTMLRQYPTAVAELTMLRRCGARLGDVLAGRCDPLELLFPQGEPVTAASLYGDSPGAREANGLVQRFMKTLVERVPPHRGVRVLEVGAGTGSTTSAILPILPAGRAEYSFTDVSPLFVNQAAERFRDVPYLRCEVLDVEQAPASQGFEPHSYDVVVAANVLHATGDLRRTLAHVRQLLVPDGVLVLLEATAPLRFIDLIFGLTEGWWRFTDFELRPSHPLLTATRWTELLGECGFSHPCAAAAPPEDGGIWSKQALIVAQAADAEPAAAGIRQGHWLVLAAQDAAIGRNLKARIEGSGQACTIVHAGAGYERLAIDRFVVNPAEPGDFRRLWQAVSGAGKPPVAGVVHLWALDLAQSEDVGQRDVEAETSVGCGSILHLVQAIASNGDGAAPGLWLVTRAAQAVGDSHTLRGLTHSTIWGMSKVISIEHPELGCVRIDLDGMPREDDPQSIVEEIRDGGVAEDQIAFRGGRRFVARLMRHNGGTVLDCTRFRADGTYLITGGLRGLGLEVARFLIERGACSLFLAGRRGADASAEERVAALRRAGASVDVVQADVSDRAQVSRLLARIDSHSPPLRGIFHSAGVLDDGIILQQSWDRFRRVFAPKVLGAWHLHVLTLDKPLDQFVLFSSMASLLGSAGQANHAAANAFLDALAHHRRSQGLPALSINWGAWSEIGAAARSDVGRRLEDKGMGSIDPIRGLQVLEYLLTQRSAQVGVAPINWPVFSQQALSGKRLVFFSQFRDPARMPGVDRPAGLLRGLKDLPFTERQDRVLACIRGQVANVLRLAPDDVDVGQPLNKMGLDSLMAMELRNRVRVDVGLDVPIITFLEEISVADLGAQLNRRLDEPKRAGSATATDPAATRIGRQEPDVIRTHAGAIDPELAADMLAQIDQMTDEQVDALLSAEFAAGSDAGSD
jgi:acyl transferase domain-containing protein/NAD(P)-dependent dehydrogenase (short-subunit alcohol dehydrogenase family)